MKSTVFAAIAVGSMLLLVGCDTVSHSEQAHIPSQKEPTELHNSTADIAAKDIDHDVAHDLESVSTHTAKSVAQTPHEGAELLNTIDVQLTHDKIVVDYAQADAGPVSFDIRNRSRQPLEVVLLKTGLPLHDIPTKDGKVDLKNPEVKQMGELVTNPLPVDGDETLTRTLEPGKYVVMAYVPNQIESAMKQVITIRPAGI